MPEEPKLRLFRRKLRLKTLEVRANHLPAHRNVVKGRVLIWKNLSGGSGHFDSSVRLEDFLDEQTAEVIPNANPVWRLQALLSLTQDSVFRFHQMIEDLDCGPVTSGRSIVELIGRPAINASQEKPLLRFKLREGNHAFKHPGGDA